MAIRLFKPTFLRPVVDAEPRPPKAEVDEPTRPTSVAVEDPRSVALRALRLREDRGSAAVVEEEEEEEEEAAAVEAAVVETDDEAVALLVASREADGELTRVTQQLAAEEEPPVLRPAVVVEEVDEPAPSPVDELRQLRLSMRSLREERPERPGDDASRDELLEYRERIAEWKAEAVELRGHIRELVPPRRPEPEVDEEPPADAEAADEVVEPTTDDVEPPADPVDESEEADEADESEDVADPGAEDLSPDDGTADPDALDAEADAPVDVPPDPDALDDPGADGDPSTVDDPDPGVDDDTRDLRLLDGLDGPDPSATQVDLGDWVRGEDGTWVNLETLVVADVPGGEPLNAERDGTITEPPAVITVPEDTHTTLTDGAITPTGVPVENLTSGFEANPLAGTTFDPTTRTFYGPGGTAVAFHASIADDISEPVTITGLPTTGLIYDAHNDRWLDAQQGTGAEPVPVDADVDRYVRLGDLDQQTVRQALLSTGTFDTVATQSGDDPYTQLVSADVEVDQLLDEAGLTDLYYDPITRTLQPVDLDRYGITEDGTWIDVETGQPVPDPTDPLADPRPTAEASTESVDPADALDEVDDDAPDPDETTAAAGAIEDDPDGLDGASEEAPDGSETSTAVDDATAASDDADPIGDTEEPDSGATDDSGTPDGDAFGAGAAAAEADGSTSEPVADTDEAIVDEAGDAPIDDPLVADPLEDSLGDDLGLPVDEGVEDLVDDPGNPVDDGIADEPVDDPLDG